MTKFYSKTTNGFYDNMVNVIPQDAVSVSDDAYAYLFDAQANGKIITHDVDGYPIAIDQPNPSQRDIIIFQIQTLENQITPRRRDEAILGIDNGWLAAKRAQIADLRATIPAV